MLSFCIYSVTVKLAMPDAAGRSYQRQVGVDDGAVQLAAMIGATAGARFRLQRVDVHRPGLGNIFLVYTGDALRDV